ncbi:hypothetical protein [Ensifer canadensis]
MSVQFEDAVDGGVQLKYSSTPLSRIDLGELRQIIHELNLLSDRLGCVVFEGENRSRSDLVIFAGNLERFSMLSAAREVSSRVFYFQDTSSWWYDGSDLLPDISGIKNFLNRHVANRHCLAFGQSSGGYAALAMGGLIPHIDVLACSPQTFADGRIKKRFYVAPSLATQHTPDHLYDIAELYRSAERRGMAAAIFSASEFNNPYESHFWIDHLHLSNIAPVPSIDIHIGDSAIHSIVFQRAALFSRCLRALLASIKRKPEVKRVIIRNLVREMTKGGGRDE